MILCASSSSDQQVASTEVLIWCVSLTSTLTGGSISYGACEGRPCMVKELNRHLLPPLPGTRHLGQASCSLMKIRNIL